MKGVIFCEFLEMVEKEFGYETVDHIITESNIASGGIYTSTGTYPHQEIFALTKALSERVQIPLEDLLYHYGKYAFKILGGHHKDLVKNYNDAFKLLTRVEDTIHVEVLKLYPEAELPRLDIRQLSNKKMEIIYKSQRRMSSFAKGLIDGCLEHYDEKCDVDVQPLNEDGTKVLFTIEKVQ